LSNFGIDAPQISRKIFHDQASMPWLSHKNGPHRFVWFLAKGPSGAIPSSIADSHFFTKLSFLVAEKAGALIVID